MLDVNALRVVRAIGDEGGFTAAANALGYSQPAVSQLVRRLERRLGTALVERHGRSVRLTEAGQVLARHAITVQGALDTADEEIAAITGLRAGRVRVMAFPSSSASVVPRALADLRARHPGLSVTFSEGEPPQSLAALRSGECDVAVAFTYPGTSAGRDVDDLSGLLTVPLLDDELHVVLPADHPLADVERIGLPQLRDEPWIAGCPRCRGHLMSLADRAGFTPAGRVRDRRLRRRPRAGLRGPGVALVPGLVLRTTTHQAVVTRPLHPTSRRSVLAVTTPDLRRVPAVHALIESLQRASR